MSSANIIASNKGVEHKRSFIYTKKSRGPRGSCIQFFRYSGKKYIAFYSVSNFGEALSYCLLYHSEIAFLVGCYDLPCQTLLLSQ